MRPNKDAYFMGLAQAVSARSSCLRRKIGAVIVRSNGMVLATGYNGAPRGMAHCLDIGCMRDQEGIKSGEQQQRCRAVHAEQNAMLQAASHDGASMAGGTLYCTISPCVICAKMMVNAGILRVVYLDEYPDQLAVEMLSEAGVEIARMV